MKLTNEKRLSFKYVIVLFSINFVFIALSVIFYSEKFNFWTYPFSYAGMRYSFEFQNPNPLSSVLYALAMILSAVVMFFYAYRINKLNPERLAYVLPLIGAIGFIIAGFSPDDTAHTFHVLGSAMFVASLWLMTTIYLFINQNKLSLKRYYFLQLIFQIPIFAYAITYFLNLGLVPNVLQKFALAGLFLVLAYTTYLIED